MNTRSPVQSKSDRLKKALVWMAEHLETHPEKKRAAVLQEAELRFDLTPVECEFLNTHFSSTSTTA
ncbi:hypothetical protein [Desulfobulbus oligotrophicus]|jgi:hypothetical protein|uniref:Uncharacterized protein n=1 Tax=Desulfobulbus oligotrophicus TaxID=1909699 RepID=A0A7T5VEE6_9BACT|nr:hypothetical protein [Desulfobulbus oligotrophicus]MDY0390221.1 hypothetical protein [Desulfobulbus oligotrophicus]QQG66281.1 hypothetical protein HP555_10615 [Desulfobulbus oligotrophicus]